MFGCKEQEWKILVYKAHSIDPVSVRELVEEILERSKDAFKVRRFGYGF